MPRRTYNRKDGRRRPIEPQTDWATLYTELRHQRRSRTDNNSEQGYIR